MLPLQSSFQSKTDSLPGDFLNAPSIAEIELTGM